MEECRPEGAFIEVPASAELERALAEFVRVRADLWVDPLLTDSWSCDPPRCRPRLGPNVCCKIERRCAKFDGRKCQIYERRPFTCALFPIELLRVRDVRLVTTVKNVPIVNLGHGRFDRDMLNCFAEQDLAAPPMLLAQEDVLRRVLGDDTWAEVVRALLS
jgi:hypothetical protein